MEEFDPESGPDEDDVGATYGQHAHAGDHIDAQRYYELKEEFERLEADIEDRTVHREEVEDDLRKYVRWRQRRGHARGWGPYLVLLYGVILTLGAFYYLEGGWAILAMFVIWLSTLGLYVFMVVTGATTRILSYPIRKIRDR